MRNNRRYMIILLGAILFCLPALGQDSAAGKSLVTDLPENSGKIDREKWIAQKDFRYMKFLDSLLKDKKLIADTIRVDKETGNPVQQQESNHFLARLFNSSGVGVLLRLLAVFFMVFIIFKVFLQSGFFKFRHRRHLPDEYKIEEDHLKEAHEYEKLILNAEKLNHWNVAIRFWYLKSLRALSDKGRIIYLNDKTNHDYIKELGGYPIQKDFEEITRHYEYVWYGRFFMNRNIYEKIRFSFEKFEAQNTKDD